MERRESEFRAGEREERVEEIHLDNIEAHAKDMASTQPHEKRRIAQHCIVCASLRAISDAPTAAPAWQVPAARVVLRFLSQKRVRCGRVRYALNADTQISST